MCRKERHAARPGDIGAGPVVGPALVAVEAVLSAGIDEDRDLGALALDGLDIGQGNAGVLLSALL